MPARPASLNIDKYLFELVPLFDLSQPTVSHHLTVLRSPNAEGLSKLTGYQIIWKLYLEPDRQNAQKLKVVWALMRVMPLIGGKLRISGACAGRFVAKCR